MTYTQRGASPALVLSKLPLGEALSGVTPIQEGMENIVLQIPASAFDQNTSALLPAGRETLSRVASMLLGSTGYTRVKILGGRANAVRDYFLQSGLPSSSVLVERGDSVAGGPVEIVIE
jgi:outer membrane protein OmpA-like peptidoglycan-associated protein